MRLSQYFLPILKENPVEASIVSHRLMLRAGMIRQQNSGIYSFLPLGLKVLQNISEVIRHNMNQAGCLELLMPCIQPADLWRESGRYDAYGAEMLRITDRHGAEMLFGPTAEDAITSIVKHNVKSYKELPKILYNIQWKFRDEIRPRFGVMRGREFLMKDAYSFDIDYESAKASYDLMFKTYLKTFHAMGLNVIAVAADTGPIGGDLSHEFHVLADTGESELYYDARFEELIQNKDYDIEKWKNIYAVAEEKYDEKNCPIPLDNVRKKRGIEVGHIFYYGDKYAKAMNASFVNKDGVNTFYEGGCYGIGVSRLIGAIIEANHDENGIIWPKEISPFAVSLINLRPGDEKADSLCEEIYTYFKTLGKDILYDDTQNSAGSKFSTHDLLGFPFQIIVGPRGAQEGKLELKDRRTGERKELSKEEFLRGDFV